MPTQLRNLNAMLLPILLLTLTTAHSDEEHGDRSAQKPRASVVNNTLYKEECGSCHMAYPPELLPASAWQNIMNGLNKHFGENAELSTASQQEIRRYLFNHSPTSRNSPVQADRTANRITKQAWFLHEHDEIPAQQLPGNARIKSLSNCAACHTRAEQGSFREREISIPGYGRWGD